VTISFSRIPLHGVSPHESTTVLEKKHNYITAQCGKTEMENLTGSIIGSKIL
jgi:hypothetical protein